MMRTKEEILQELPTDLSEIEKYEGSNNIECRVRVGTLETLLDIRDILAEVFLDEETRKKWDEQAKVMARKKGI